jgi:hypothetical protein
MTTLVLSPEDLQFPQSSPFLPALALIVAVVSYMRRREKLGG